MVATPARAQEPTRFSLSMFHFNIQYVAGGLTGFPDGVSHLPELELDDAAVQDRIITQSFEPALDLLLAHSTWKLTLELQGYMVEVMLQRHPDVLAKLQQLVDEGRVELVSVHWSDQLFLAYPRLDLERSRELVDAVMAQAGLTLSPVTFCQEGQFGEGLGEFGPEHGQTILGLPKNLFRFQHAATVDTAAPLYRLGDADVVLIGREFGDESLQVTWSFFDDGELWSTNRGSPYMGENFAIDLASTAQFEQDLADREAAGFRIATIQEYVEWVKEMGLPQPPLPPMLDGTWQPSSTDSMFRWMGKAGILDVFFECERDNEVLVGNVHARHEIVAAETLITWARSKGLYATDEQGDGLTDCWRWALLGQVTDASGINPFVNEVRYGIEHAQEARRCASSILADIAGRQGRPFLEVDTESGTVTPLDRRPAEHVEPEVPLLPRDAGFTVDAPGREVDVLWEAIGEPGRLHRVTIGASAPVGVARRMTVTFPFELDELRLSPGLVEDEVRTYRLADFDLENGNIALPLANGLLGLREGLWLIKDTQSVHVAATIRVGEPNVLFRDETMDPEGDVTWAFYLFEGTADEALAEANRRNVRPTVIVAGPPAVRGSGCACRGAPGGAPKRPNPVPFSLVALLAILRARAHLAHSRR